MKQFQIAPLVLAMTIGLVGCAGDDGKDGAQGQKGDIGASGLAGSSALIKQSVLAVGHDQCVYGGVQIDTGVDGNGNNALEASEVSQTEYVCKRSDDSIFTLQLLHFADIDGGRDIVKNAAYFSALVNAFRDEYSNTVVLSSGDNWIPGPEYSVADGRAHMGYLNELGVQASAFGNHEFDLGTEAVAELLTEDGDYPGSMFPYLSSNLDFSTDDNLSPLIGSDGAPYKSLMNQVAASTVIRVGGELVGVVGATTPTLNVISSPGDIGISPADSSDLNALAAEIQTRVDALTAKGINKVIVLSHMQQISIEKSLAPLLQNVDIIVAGGSNTLLADSNDRMRDGDTPADTYPLALTSKTNEPVLVVNTDGDYTYLGRLVAEFDQDGVLLTSTLNDAINGVYAADEQGLLEQGLSVWDGIETVVNISIHLEAELKKVVGNVFGNTDVYINGARGSVRTEETNMGNLTAQANLAYAQATEAAVAISLKNGGGIRAAIGQCTYPPGSTNPEDLVCSAPQGVPGINEPGDISQLDIQTTLRFNNGLTLMTLTGTQLAGVIEHAVSGWAEGATPGSFGQVAGVRYSFDPTLAAGSRIVNLVIDDSNGAEAGSDSVVVVENGVLDATAANQSFRIVTLGYLAGGGDGYPFPASDDAAANMVSLVVDDQFTGTATFAEDGTEQDALAEYLLANHPVDGSSNFAEADTTAENDTVIQNLSVVPVDTILPVAQP